MAEEVTKTRDTKQIIVVRKDLGMNVGKACAQVAHAAMMFMSRALREGVSLQELPEPFQAWISDSFTKVVTGVDSTEALMEVKAAAEAAGIPVSVVVDARHTQFRGEKTLTCIAVGPWWSDEIDLVTRKLLLWSDKVVPKDQVT